MEKDYILNTNINITKLADNTDKQQNSTHPILLGVNKIKDPNGGPSLTSTFFPFTNINNSFGTGLFMNV
jgi:hypothetical protein